MLSKNSYYKMIFFIYFEIISCKISIWHVKKNKIKDKPIFLNESNLCGDNDTFIFENTTLTISGTDDMFNFSQYFNYLDI